MEDQRISVVMYASGGVKELNAGAGFREILEWVYRGAHRQGGDLGSPTKLFVGGECVVSSGLADIARDFAEFQREKEAEIDAALDAWVERRFGTQAGEAA